MDLRQYVLSLMRPLRLGDSLLPGIELQDASIELGPRLTFSTPHGPVHVELTPRERTSRFAAATETFAVSYRAGSSDHPVEPRLGLAICEAVAERLVSHPAAVPAAPAPRVREVEVQRLLEHRHLGAQSHYTLSPYVGCVIGCRFCYAQSRLHPARALMGLPQLPWGAYVDVRTNAASVLAEELRHRAPGPIKFCPIVSDPYQPLERKYRLTRACLEVLQQGPPGFTPLVLTRTAAVLDDLDRLVELPGAVVGVSLPSADPQVLSHFEPRAASLRERIHVLSTLASAGVQTMAIAQPMLPGPVAALADLLARHADSVSLDRLRGTYDAGSLFDDPRYAGCAEDAWQARRLCEVGDALRARGVPLWPSELPPGLPGIAPR